MGAVAKAEVVMARTKAVLGTGARLADFLSASLLARVVPAEVVNAVLDAHGCNSQRVRSFPAVAGAYYCMALSLYPGAIPVRRVGDLPAVVASAEAGNAVHGRPGVQRLRALAPGASHRGAVALALRGQPPVARPSHARRRFVPERHLPHWRGSQRGG